MENCSGVRLTMVTFVRTAIINGIDNGLLVIIVQDKIMEIGIIYLFRENDIL